MHLSLRLELPCGGCVGDIGKFAGVGGRAHPHAAVDLGLFVQQKFLDRSRFALHIQDAHTAQRLQIHVARVPEQALLHPGLQLVFFRGKVGCKVALVEIHRHSIFGEGQNRQFFNHRYSLLSYGASPINIRQY